jgi:nucleoid-associated protein YgaU
MLIYEANKAGIGDNPNRISPGMVLNIPKLES